jgi:hypothetical protein
MSGWMKRAIGVLLLLAIILAGPRIFYDLFVPFLQVIFLVAPLVITVMVLSGRWRRRRNDFQTSHRKID